MLYLIHVCSAKAKIAGVPIIQRLGGQQQWTPYVRCLQRSCSREGGGKANFSRGNSVVQTRATREFARVRLRLSLYRPFTCHQSTRPLHCVRRARGDASRMLCCAHRHRAQIPSSDNIDDTQRGACAGARTETRIPHSRAFGSSINFQSILDFPSKRKKERRESVFLRYTHKSAKPSFFSQYPLYHRRVVPLPLGKLTKGGEKKRKTFHPSFIHVITSISISRRISNSLVPVCTYPRIYARVTRTSVSVVANIKEGRGRARARHVKTQGGEGREPGLYTYIPCSEIRNTLDDSLSSAGKQPHSRNSLPG